MKWDFTRFKGLNLLKRVHVCIVRYFFLPTAYWWHWSCPGKEFGGHGVDGASGEARFRSCSCGNSPRVARMWGKVLRMRGVEMQDVDRAYTSQSCNCWKNKVIKAGAKGLTKKRRSLTATCMCKTMNPENAALWILLVFTKEMLHGRRR
jgi:hypothetical protein